MHAPCTSYYCIEGELLIKRFVFLCKDKDGDNKKTTVS